MNIFDLSGTTGAVIAAAIALVPAIVAHFRGRQIARLADDPALHSESALYPRKLMRYTYG